MTELVVWLVPCGIIAAVLTAGATVWESAARWSGRPARWAWLGALTGSVVLPFVLRLLPGETWRGAVPAVGVVRLDALGVTAAASADPAIGISTVALATWVVLSALLVSYTGALLVRLARARRLWRPAEVDGAPVLVSRNTGPAAVGVRRGIVVIPAWALELDAELRRLMLLHESEHVRAGDPRVLLGALALIAVMPWNPLVWLQLLRLRNAIELDCDARVLRRGVNPTRYGSLLLEIGQRRGGNALVLATFAEPRAFLEQRIRRIAEWPLQRRPLRAALLSLVALALFSTALLARVRVETAGPSSRAPSGMLQVLGLPGGSGEPQLKSPVMSADTPPPRVRPVPRQTAYTKAPTLRNAEAVMKRMTERYPPLLRDAGIGGTANVWVLVDAAGSVREVELAKTSGAAELDEAALSVARTMDFEPAQHRSRPVPVWIEVPLTFGQLAHSVTVSEQPVRARRIDPTDTPAFTPMTVRPELRNQVEVQRALIQYYPPLLRDAGIGGTATVWFYIDETGQVRTTQLSKSSGYPALDDAAQRVAATMQFSPAQNRDEVVAVWVEIPIMFTTRQPSPRSPEPVPAGAAPGTRERVPAPRPGPPDVESAVSALRRPAPVPGSDATAQARPPERRPAAVPANDASIRPSSEPRRAAPLSVAPAFTPMTARPELQNQIEVQRALIRSYPPVLRDAGIGGTAVIWFFIDETGKVAKLQLSKTSGYPALDEAALFVAATMRFSPARNREAVVPVWVEIPIMFAAK